MNDPKKTLNKKLRNVCSVAMVVILIFIGAVYLYSVTLNDVKKNKKDVSELIEDEEFDFIWASPPCPSLTGAPGRQKDRPGFPVEPALKWQVACGRKISAAFSTLADLRSASLRATRRAANAQKRSNDHTPRFKMPHRIRLDHPDAHASAQCSSLRNET